MQRLGEGTRVVKFVSRISSFGVPPRKKEASTRALRGLYVVPYSCGLVPDTNCTNCHESALEICIQIHVSSPATP